jgi:MoaA/NifB/PqqE/SkfB family radical SAM enzyme
MKTISKVDIKFCFSCNNRCLFCVQGDKRNLYNDFSTKELEKKIESARIESDKIVFTGGEVTIRNDFLYLLNLSKKLNFNVIQIQTNGRMLSDLKFCEKTINAGATDFSLALHGHIIELHDYLTRAHGSFFQTVKAIKNLKYLNQYIGINTVITRSNYRNLPDIANLLVYLSVDQFQFAFVHAVGEASKNFLTIVPRFSLIEQYVKQGLSIGINANKVVMTEAIPYCFMVDYTDYIAESIIPRTKIYDIIDLEDYTEYRLKEGKLKSKNCENCKFNKICEGPWREYPNHYGWDEFVSVKS